MNTELRQQRSLRYPDHWSQDTVDRFENLHDMGKMSQSEVDRIAERLQWYREWRDYFATTGGVDETLNHQDYVA